MKLSRLLIVAFFIVFMFLGLQALRQGMPSEKNERIYTMLQKHMPYEVEKRAGGFSIKSKITGIKEKPPAKDIFLRLEQLEKLWGKEFLKLENNILVVMDKNKKTVTKILLKTDEEKKWVKEYFEFK
ncbi:hypothetical protein [Arcobacter sp. LA11]|uniref:hypothetical protein n=1 Tax=Arcobacter sp. LA11 TaxID=1898176 RepID=UPI000934DD76|nr:hypothetical protein [Arcobacter sp. LA11]